MLGIGRPFYFEIINPKNLLVSQQDLTDLIEKVNSEVPEKVRYTDLQHVSR